MKPKTEVMEMKERSEILLVPGLGISPRVLCP